MNSRQRTLEPEEVAAIHSAMKDLQDLRDGFVKEMWMHMCGNVVTLRRAVMERDPEMVTYWAHRCKGVIGQLQARRALDLLSRLEMMGRSRQLDGIEGLLAELGQEMELIEAIVIRAETEDATGALRYDKYLPMSDLCSG